MAQIFSVLGRTVFVAWLLCLGSGQVSAQCDPDVTPPVAICNGEVFVSLPSDGSPAVLDFTAFDGGSYDDCCLGIIDLKRTTDGQCDADADPDDYASSVVFCCADLGVPTAISMRVSDCSGNTSECLITVFVALLRESPDQVLPRIEK